MFSERMALKLRLEELDKREQRVAKEIKEEREGIYERLRKLDEQDRYLPPIVESDMQPEGIIIKSTSTNIPSQQLHEKELKKTVDSIEEIIDNVKKDVEKIASDAVVELVKTEVQPQLEKTEQWVKIEREQSERLKEQLEKNTVLLNEAQVVMNKAESMLIKQSEEKEELTKQLAESSSIILRFEKLFENNGEITKVQKGMKRDRNQRKGRKNQETKVSSRSSDQEKIDYTPLYDTAVKILMQHTASIPSHELKKEIETKNATKIQNMTTFMQRLMKIEPAIEKPFRGEYIYRRDEMEQLSSEKEIAVGSEENKQENTQTNDILEDSMN